MISDFHIVNLEEVKEIFFLTSTKKNFSNDLEKEIFFQKWLGNYLNEKRSDLFSFVYILEQKVVAYIVGTKNSIAWNEEFINRSEMVFCHLFAKYPVHFHINCHPGYQGLGIGKKLLKKVEEACFQQGLNGIHLITEKEASNVSFYEKCGYQIIESEVINSITLVFMGKLNAESSILK